MSKAAARTKKKRTQAPRSSNNAGKNSRLMKRIKQGVDVPASGEDDAADVDLKTRPRRFRGNRGKLAVLTKFPLDVLLEVCSLFSESASALWFWFMPGCVLMNRVC